MGYNNKFEVFGWNYKKYEDKNSYCYKFVDFKWYGYEYEEIDYWDFVIFKSTPIQTNYQEYWTVIDKEDETKIITIGIILKNETIVTRDIYAEEIIHKLFLKDPEHAMNNPQQFRKP